MDKEIINLIKGIGLDDKSARIYLAALECGEATVQQLAAASGIKRTTIYYILEELTRSGALIATKRYNKIYYLAETPKNVLKRAREKISEFEDGLDRLEAASHKIYPKPRLYFLYGPTGFKKVWEMIFENKDKQFCIMTEGLNFLDFVKEKYILDEIIRTKKRLGISSRQLIVDSDYARKIIVKDAKENRVSKIIPAAYKLPFTEIICQNFVAFISNRYENISIIIENDAFAKTRQSMFDLLWDSV